jgi:hypothetical protein
MSALARLRRRRRRWALLALPALLLRALLPVGFMPLASADGFSLELCPDAGRLPAAASAAADLHAHHHHHADAGQDASSAAHHAPCLFAASAQLATAPGDAAAAGPATPAIAPRDACRATRRFVPSILRSQAPRAPPVPAL